MKAWDVFDYPFAWGTHPAVIISHNRRMANKPEVVILACRTMRADTYREPDALECLLNESDGLDGKALCKCDLLFTVRKADLQNRRGAVSVSRRRDIASKLIQGLAIAGL